MANGICMFNHSLYKWVYKIVGCIHFFCCGQASASPKNQGNKKMLYEGSSVPALMLELHTASDFGRQKSRLGPSGRWCQRL